MTFAILLCVQVTSEHCSIRLLLEKRLANTSIQDNMSEIHQWTLVQTNSQTSSVWLVYLLSLGSSYFSQLKDCVTLQSRMIRE